MSKKQKQGLIIAGIVEAAIIIFCLVVSIIVLTTFHDPNSALPIHTPPYSSYKEANLDLNGKFIGTLQNNSTLFFCCFVLPMFVILAVDIVYLITWAVKRESKLTDNERKAIEEEARRQAREEALAELKAEKKE